MPDDLPVVERGSDPFITVWSEKTKTIVGFRVSEVVRFGQEAVPDAGGMRPGGVKVKFCIHLRSGTKIWCKEDVDYKRIVQMISLCNPILEVK